MSSLAPTEAHTPLPASTHEDTSPDSVVRPHRLTDDEKALILAMKAQHRPITEISDRLERNWRTVADYIAEVEDTPDEIARKLLGSYKLQAISDYARASAKASDKGDHRPARELLQDTGVIERQDNNVGAKVAVIIGLPESMRPQVVDSTLVRE